MGSLFCCYLNKDASILDDHTSSISGLETFRIKASEFETFEHSSNYQFSNPNQILSKSVSSEENLSESIFLLENPKRPN